MHFHTGCVVTLLMMSVWTTTAAPATSPDPCNAFRNHPVEESQFTFGHNGLKITGGCYKLAAFNDDLTAIQCMKRCLKIPGCQSISYTWLPPYNTNRCYLYDDVTQQSEGTCKTEVAFSRAAGDWETHDITRDCRTMIVQDCDSYTHIDDRNVRLGPECGYPQTVYDYKLKQSCRQACSDSSWCVAYEWSILVGTGTARKRCALFPLNPRLYKGCELERGFTRRERRWLYYKDCEGLTGDDKTVGGHLGQHDSPIKNCEDQYRPREDHCRRWRLQGECRRNANVRNNYCQKTCGLC